MPKLSVLIPTYNRKVYIAEAIRSVLTQPFRDLEVIVSDNASTDGTPEIVQALAAQDNRVRLLRQERNLGPIKNWRACLDNARGAFSHWLWSDDYVEPEFYPTWARLQAEGAACVQVAAYLTSAQSREVLPVYAQERLSFKTIIEASPKQLLITASPAAYVLPTASLRRHFYDAIPQTKRLRCVDSAIGPDLLMVLGAVMDAGELRLHPQPLVNFRIHAESISTQRNHVLKPHYTFALAWFIATHRLGMPPRAALELMRKGIKYRAAVIFHAGFGALGLKRIEAGPNGTDPR